MIYSIIEYMILDYVKFKKSQLSTESPLYFIHGNPRNISNEIEHDVLNFYQKLGYKSMNYVVDDDSQIQKLESLFNEQSLFNENKIIILNIVSNSISIKMKRFIETWIEISTDDKIILKLDRQASSFKKTNFYKKISQYACVIEIFELKNEVLKQWSLNKCKVNQVEISDSDLEELMNSNFNNSLSISQNIYIQSLMNSNQLIHGQEGSKYSEYDLVDMFLSRNTLEFIRASNYLRSNDTSLSYIIFLLNSELEKLYSLIKPIKYRPYIPSFLLDKYLQVSKKFSPEKILSAINNIATLDAKSKYNLKKSNPWESFNSMFLDLMKS